MDGTFRLELRELNEQNARRFEERLDQRTAELRTEMAELRQEMTSLKADLIKVDVPVLARSRTLHELDILEASRGAPHRLVDGPRASRSTTGSGHCVCC